MNNEVENCLEFRDAVKVGGKRKKNNDVFDIITKKQKIENGERDVSNLNLNSISSIFEKNSLCSMIAKNLEMLVPKEIFFFCAS